LEWGYNEIEHKLVDVGVLLNQIRQHVEDFGNAIAVVF